MFIDIHCHLLNPPHMEDGVRISNLFPDDVGLYKGLHATAGIHPWYIDVDKHQEQFLKIQSVADNPVILAIGETGLDKRSNISFTVQEYWFEEQLKLAESVNKPLIIHCVKAFNEIIEYRKRYNKTPWIFHRFGGTVEIAEILTKLNCYFSFHHAILSDNSTATKVIQSLNVDNVFLETDAEHADQEYTIQGIYAKAAILKNTDVPSLQEKITTNFTNCFNRSLCNG